MRTNAREILVEIEKNLRNLIFDVVFDVDINKPGHSLQMAQRLRSNIISKIIRIKESHKNVIMLGELVAWAQGMAEYLRDYQDLNERHFDQVREAMTNLKTTYRYNIRLSEKERVEFIRVLETVRNITVMKNLTVDVTEDLGKSNVKISLLRVFSFLTARIRGEIVNPTRADISWEEYFGIVSLAFALDMFDEDTATQVFKVGSYFLMDSSIASQKKDHESTH